MLLVQGYLALVPANFWQWSLDLQKDDWKITDFENTSWKGFVSTFQNLKITEFTVCLTRRPLEKRTKTQYYRTRPSKNFETVNLEIPNSKILKAQTLSKLGIPCSNGLMNVAKLFSVCLILYKLLLKNFTFYSKLYKVAIISHTLLFTSYSKSFAKEKK